MGNRTRKNGKGKEIIRNGETEKQCEREGSKWERERKRNGGNDTEWETERKRCGEKEK